MPSVVPKPPKQIFATKADIDSIQEGLNDVQTDNKNIMAALDQLLDGKGRAQVRHRGESSHAGNKTAIGSAPSNTYGRKRSRTAQARTQSKVKGKAREQQDSGSDGDVSDDDSESESDVKPKHRPAIVLQRQVKCGIDRRVRNYSPTFPV